MASVGAALSVGSELGAEDGEALKLGGDVGRAEGEELELGAELGNSSTKTRVGLSPPPTSTVITFGSPPSLSPTST